MVVESKLEMQDVLRDYLKKRGYRVLILSDPERALARFNEYDPPCADCVMFCTAELGADALQAFNTFASTEYTKEIPAILCIHPKQASQMQTANLAAHRVLITLPIKVKELRHALVKLLNPVNS